MAALGTRAVIEYAFQLALSCVFVLASLTKVHHPIRFRQIISNYAVLPTPLVPLVAPVVIISEAFVAITLATGYLAELGLHVAVSLLSAFVLGVGINLRRGRQINCGCFGSENDSISERSLARIGLLLAPALALMIRGGSRITVAVLIAGGASSLEKLTEALSLAAFLLVISAWLLALPELAQAFRPARVYSAHDATGSQR